MYLTTLFDLTLSNQCRLLVNFANNLGPDKTRQNLIRSKLFGTQRFFFEKVDFEKKNQQPTSKHAKLLSRQSVKGMTTCNKTYEPRHEISINVVCAASKVSDQPAHMRSLIRAFACPRIRAI